MSNTVNINKSFRFLYSIRQDPNLLPRTNADMNSYERYFTRLQRRILTVRSNSIRMRYLMLWERMYDFLESYYNRVRNNKMRNRRARTRTNRVSRNNTSNNRNQNTNGSNANSSGHTTLRGRMSRSR